MTRSIKRPARRTIIWNKTQGHCAHCGRLIQAGNQTVDHFIPQADGGGSDKRNLMPLCRSCNMRRSDEPVDPWEYYRYAPKWAKRDCEEYEKEWRSFHTNLAGELV